MQQAESTASLVHHSAQDLASVARMKLPIRGSDWREEPATHKILSTKGAGVSSDKNARLCMAGVALPT